MTDIRRWYDKDPILKEALDLLCLSDSETKDQAADFMLQLQEQVAADVIERLYDQMNEYSGNGARWYDNDPIMMKGIELLRVAPPNVQRTAAKKLLLALTRDSFEGLETDFENAE